MSRRLLIILLSTALFAAGACGDEASMVRLIEEKATVRVEIGGKHFTTYYFADGMGRPYVRPFFYPVLAADGTPLTSDQATAGGDHPHHRSLWVAHGDVNGADHWSLNAKPPPRQRHIRFVSLAGDTIVQELQWEDKTSEPILRETRTMRFIVYPDGARAIDFKLVFEPLDKPVTFGDTKEAGLCSVRMAKEISKNPAITNSAGATGEKACWGKPAKWCDQSGVIDGKPFGIAILDHPSNPRHPATWHVRAYGLMTANIFGLHDFDPKKPKGAGNLTIEKGKPVTFRYRVVVHAGDAAAAKIDEKWQHFAAE